MKGEFATRSTIVKDHEVTEEQKQKKPYKGGEWTPESVQTMLNRGMFYLLDLNERASNSWAIAGKYTESGHPLLANDPHLDAALPG